MYLLPTMYIVGNMFERLAITIPLFWETGIKTPPYKESNSPIESSLASNNNNTIPVHGVWAHKGGSTHFVWLATLSLTLTNSQWQTVKLGGQWNYLTTAQELCPQIRADDSKSKSRLRESMSVSFSFFQMGLMLFTWVCRMINFTVVHTFILKFMITI